MVRYTKGFDYTPADHFSRSWTLRTMHGKQQFVTQNVAAWCLRGLLATQQEETLFNLFKVINRLVQPSYTSDQLPELISDTSTAIALLERDFPLTLQNITTHLLHHVPEGYGDFGPLYDRWLYPLERANSWITRQILQHGHEESTVMQTYSIYDWSSFNILSGEQADYGRNNSLCCLAERINSDCEFQEYEIKQKKTNSITKILTTLQIATLQEKYINNLGKHIEKHEIDPVVQSLKTVTRFDKKLKKNLSFATFQQQHSGRRSCDCYVNVINDSGHFGRIRDIFQQNHSNKDYTWIILDLYPVAELCDQFWCTEDKTIRTEIYSFEDISNPLVTAVENRKLWFLNV